MIKRYNASVVALVMDDQGIPQSKDQALDVGVNLIDNLLRDGVPVEEIYVDPLVRSVATNQDTIVETLALMNAIGAKVSQLTFYIRSQQRFLRPSRTSAYQSGLRCPQHRQWARCSDYRPS